MEKDLLTKCYAKEMMNYCKPETFGELCELWLLSKKVKLKLSTYMKYQYLFKDYIIPQLGKLPINEFSTPIFDYAMMDIYSKDGTTTLSNSIMKTILYLVNAVLKYAARARYIDYVEITFELPKIRTEEVKTLTIEQERCLVAYILNEVSDNHLGILLSLSTGMRIGEVCALQRKDVDLEKGIIHICKTVQRLKEEKTGKTKLVVTEPKSKKSYRDIPIPKILFGYMQRYNVEALEQECYILGRKETPYEPRTLQYSFGRVLECCDIGYMNFHCLRHTFATKCIRFGGDIKTVSELLGHSNVNFTMNRYVHSDFEQKRKQMILLDSAWSEMNLIS